MNDVEVSFASGTREWFVVSAGPRDTELCKTVPGMRAGKADPRKAEVEWRAPATWYHALVLRSVFGERLVYGPEVVAWAQDQAASERVRQYIRIAPVRPGGLMYDYQKTGANWLYDAPSILGDDMGTGKTIQALQALNARRRTDHGLYDALVVTTSSMKFKWAEEAKTWAPAWLNVVVIDGSAAQRSKLIENAKPGTLFIVNWETLAKHTRLAGFGSVSLSAAEKSDKELNRRPIHYVIADEAHRAKDPTTKQTRALWHVSRKASRRWALTGTPIANQHVDLWSLLHFVDPLVWPSRGDFIDRYIYGYQADWGFEPVGWNKATQAELFRFVDLYLLRRTKEEVLPDLPPKTYERRMLDLTPKQATAYRSMKKELLASIDGDLLLAGDPLTKAGRLSQIASATPVLQVIEGVAEDGSPFERTEVVALDKPSNKVSALKEILAETDEPLVVFAASRKLIDLVEQEITTGRDKVTAVRITGTESAEERAINVRMFQEGTVRVALCTFGAGSEGITLTRAGTAVFLQRPWSLVQSKQAEDRIHRIGQEASAVLIIDLVSQGTIDEEVFRTIVEKQETLESVTRDRARLRALLGES